MTTVVRVQESVPQKSFTVDFTHSNYKNEINHQPSSPLSSYAVDNTQDTMKVVLTHTQCYPEHLESNKQKINGLHSEMDALREKIEEMDKKVRQLVAEREADKNTLLDFETKSRLVQALNDYHIFKKHLIPKDLYDSLKVEGCSYLPYLLSVCAVYYNEEVATCLEISREKQDNYEAKAAKLIEKGLQNDLDSIWFSLPELNRDLMIKLWLTRPANIRTSVAHSKPTINEGINVTCADSRLSEAERCFINNFIPIAVDKTQKRLFT